MTVTNSIKAAIFASVALCFSQWVSAANLPDFTGIVKQGSPAVVKIIVEHKVNPQSRRNSEQEIPEYLRRFFEFRGGPPDQGSRRESAMGSGFLISADGYIVTNNHVVEEANSVIVRLSDRSEYDADVIGTDPRSDLALLKIDSKDLPFVRLAKAGELQVGEWVLAIGSPFGLDYSVTAGIVSAKGRSLPTENNENYVPFIQTDVAINPGNSGGPLFNLKGEVVGVNSQIFTRSGGSIGLSFSIPVNVVRNVVDQLKASGKVTRGWLGVSIQNVDRTLAESFGLDKPVGALVAQVAKGSPAEAAGIEAGDVIVSFDGTEIQSSADLPHVVGLLAPNTKASMEVVRNKKRKTLSVKVGGLDGDDSFALDRSQSHNGIGGRLGMIVDTAKAENLERWGLSGGVVIQRIIPNGLASDLGVAVGDIITLIDNTPIKSVGDYEKAVANLKDGASVPLRLIRGGNPLFIGLKLK